MENLRSRCSVYVAVNELPHSLFFALQHHSDDLIQRLYCTMHPLAFVPWGPVHAEKFWDAMKTK